MKKSVNFNEDLNMVHLLVVWNYASRQARKSEYQKHYLDRLRFEKRIEKSENILCKIFDVNFRKLIYKQRFENS